MVPAFESPSSLVQIRYVRFVFFLCLVGQALMTLVTVQWSLEITNYITGSTNKLLYTSALLDSASPIVRFLLLYPPSVAFPPPLLDH